MDSNDSTSDPRRVTREVPARRVLGEVSPNLKVAPLASRLGLDKRISGSPLKRSFSVAIEEQGLKYFKRSKISSDSLLSGRNGNVSEDTRGPNAEEPHMLPGHEQVCQTVFCPVFDTPTCVQPLPESTVMEHPTPTEPNTPSVISDDEGDSSSAERRSFSSLINYDPSSQPQHNPQTSQRLLFQGPSYAELLRLRLRVAYYKVRTNQISVPFAELREEHSGEMAPAADIRPHMRNSPASHAVPNSHAHPRQMLGLRQPPVLRPTPYSNRVFHEISLPSPPSALTSPVRLPQLATPDGATRIAPLDDTELTSSIVKGRGAEALLGLRNAI